MALFGKKKTESDMFNQTSNEPQKSTTFIGKNLTIKGIITGDDDLKIHGILDGEMDLKADLQIGQTANVTGKIKSKTLSVSGNVDGAIQVQTKVHLDKSAKVKATLSTPKLSVIEGAVFDGDLKMSQAIKNTPLPPINKESVNLDNQPGQKKN